MPQRTLKPGAFQDGCLTKAPVWLVGDTELFAGSYLPRAPMPWCPFFLAAGSGQPSSSSTSSPCLRWPFSAALGRHSSLPFRLRLFGEGRKRASPDHRRCHQGQYNEQHRAPHKRDLQ
jgi:hypothetical protein